MCRPRRWMAISTHRIMAPTRQKNMSSMLSFTPFAISWASWPKNKKPAYSMSSQTGAVIHDVKVVAERVLGLVQTGKVQAIDGTEIALKADTICVHGDTPGAVEMIKEIRELLEKQGITLKAFGIS